MTPAQKKGVEEAMTRIAQVHDYCGCAVVLVADNFAQVSVHKHSLRDEFLDRALFTLLDQRNLPSSRIVVPDYINRKGG